MLAWLFIVERFSVLVWIIFPAVFLNSFSFSTLVWMWSARHWYFSRSSIKINKESLRWIASHCWIIQLFLLKLFSHHFPHYPPFKMAFEKCWMFNHQENLFHHIFYPQILITMDSSIKRISIAWVWHWLWNVHWIIGSNKFSPSFSLPRHDNSFKGNNYWRQGRMQSCQARRISAHHEKPLGRAFGFGWLWQSLYFFIFFFRGWQKVDSREDLFLRIILFEWNVGRQNISAHFCLNRSISLPYVTENYDV